MLFESLLLIIFAIICLILVLFSLKRTWDDVSYIIRDVNGSPHLFGNISKIILILFVNIIFICVISFTYIRLVKDIEICN